MSNFLPVVDNPISAVAQHQASPCPGAPESDGLPHTTAQAILFIMGDVHDFPALLGGLAAHTEVHLLDPASDGLRQIVAILAGRRELSALHLLSHGGPGRLALGTLTLDCNSLAWYPEVWMTLRAALRADASVFLYGCEVAADEGGFAAALADACGVAVVASRTLTGAAACGGDWELTYRSGPVSAELPFSAQALERFSGVLSISNGVQNLSMVPGSFADLMLTDGNWIYSALNGGFNGNQVISDTTRIGLADYDYLGTTAASYLEVKLSNTGSFKLLAANVGEDVMTMPSDNNFYNIYIAGYANGVQVATSATYSSLGVTESSYSLTLGTLAGTDIDTFRVYFTGNAAVLTGALGLSSFVIDGYSTSAAINNTSPIFVGVATTLDTTQNSAASALASLLHVSDVDSAQTLNWTPSTAPTHGTLSFAAATADSGSSDLTPAGSISYTPDAGFAGTDSFTVQVSDGTAIATRTISVNVAPLTPGIPELAAASDSGSSASDRITNSATLDFSGSGAAGDSSSTVRVFIDKDGNGNDDAGTDIDATATMSGGSWSVSGLSTSGLGDGTYQVYAIATSATGGLSSATGAGLAVTIDQTAPTISFGNLALSADSGSSASDFITGAPAQTITATLNASPAAGDVVQGSLDNGAQWSDLTAMVSGTQLSWTGVTLTGSDTLKLRVIDHAGNPGTVLSQAYTCDSDSPAAPATPVLDAGSDSGSSSSDGITSLGTPTIHGSGEAGATVTLYDSDGTTVLGSSLVSAGSWSITTSSLTAGYHNLSARQTDVAGNISSASTELGITLDAVAPAALALSHTTVQLAAATSGATVATISATDSDSIRYATANGDGSNDADNANFTVAGDALQLASSLNAGTYHVYLQASDLAGNVSYQAFEISVLGAPQVSSIVRSGAAAAEVLAATSSLSYTVSFDQSVTGVDLSDFTLVCSAGASAELASLSGSGTTYTITVGSVAGDGQVQLVLNGSGTGIQNADGVAVAGGYSGGESYQLDHSAPAVPGAPALSAATDTGSSSSDAISSHTTPLLLGVAEASVTVSLYDGATLLGTTSADGSGHWSYSSTTLAPGLHTLTARASDAAGNLSAASAALSVVIDTAASAPAALILGAASDSGSSQSDRVTNLATPLITGSAEAGASVRLYDTDGTTLLGSTNADGNGIWSITSSVLADGSHSLSAIQTDLAGNVSAASATLGITIDTAAPAAPGVPVLASASDTGALGDYHTETTAPAFTGLAEAYATVRLYDSDATHLLGSSIADAAGHWSIGSSVLTLGVHNLTVRQTDVAGNLSAASASLSLTIDSPPPAPVVPPIPLIDGVAVQERPVTLPGGGAGTELVIPIISAERADSSGSHSTADIPLASASGSTLLLAQLPSGFGLTASGSNPASGAAASQSLLNAILGATAHHSGSDQSSLNLAAGSFLQALPVDAPLLVQTIKLNNDGTGGVLTLTGSHQALQKTALILDCSSLDQQGSVSLNAVSFATILGAATVQANTSGQTLIGDAQNQNFLFAQTTPSSIFAGGGTDTFRISQTAAASGSGLVQGGAAASVANITSVLHGGQGEDTASFAGPRSAYTVEYHHGYQLVTANATPGQHALLINVETLQFGDQTQSVQNRAELASIDGLYQQILGRQADYRGMDFWAGRVASGISLGQTALDMLDSAEWHQQHGSGVAGNHGHDIELLYQNLFGRHSDAAGLGFWLGQMEHGVTLQQVAQSFVSAPEMEAHKIGVQDWNFSS